MATDDDAADGYISIDSSKDERGLTLGSFYLHGIIMGE